jgi:MHS family proline/betaine transporter-like MFS transporter
MSAAALQDWGWRLPFLLGAGIAVYALVLRRGMAESPVMQSATPAPRLPAVEALRHHWGAILRLVCIVMPTAVVYYIVFVFAASFLTQQMHISTARALDINTAALILLVVTCPVAGLASDRFGRRRALFFTTLGNVLLAWPLWYALHIDSLAWILVGQLGFAFINGVGWSQVVPLMVELMPARVRCTAAGIGYNVCLALFGGATPWVATYLISRTADDFAPAYYAMAVSAIAFIAALRMPETAGRPLRE